jgi:diguanylate cyclase (GGDEF)-like protein
MSFSDVMHRVLPAKREATREGSGKGLVLATGLGLAAICLVFAAVLYDDYLEVRARAILQASNIAALADQDIARNIELYNLSIQAVIDGVSDPDVMRQPAAIRQAILFDRSATARGMGSLLVLDETGTIIIDSASRESRSGNFADRDYFLVHKTERTDSGLYISHPYQSRLRQGDWSIALSRRLAHQDGSFAGIVFGTMRLEYFKELFGKISLGEKGAMYLAHQDGMLLMRLPFDEALIGRDLTRGSLLKRVAQAPTGNYESLPFDGIPRLYSYRKIGDFPLIVSVGLSIDEIMAPWWNKAEATGLSLLALCGVVLLLMLRSRAELRRRLIAETALAVLASTDELTGLANRRKLDEMLDFEWCRAERDDTRFSVLMIDVDFFKAYNDAYGHLEGDKVLATLGACIKAPICRPADLAARFGGEEFAILLPDTDYAGALHIAEKIRRSVFDLGLPHAKNPSGCVTVSLGVATVRPRHADFSSTLMRAADRALYAAKTAGRNQVIGADDANIQRLGLRVIRGDDHLIAI